MKTVKTLVNIAAALYSLVAVVLFMDVYEYFDITDFSTILFFVMVSAIVTLFILASKEEFLVKYRVLLLIIGIILFIPGIISSILLFVAFGLIKPSMNSPGEVKVKEKVSPEVRRIDILTKFGVFLIVLSGLIYATGYNDYETSNIIKPIIMLCFSFLFYGLYILFEKKFVIKSSSKMYYILSHAFFFITFITIGYYGTFGEISYDGYYSNIMVAINLIVGAFNIAMICNKYNYKFLEASVICIIVALILLFTALELYSWIIIYYFIIYEY